MLRLASFLILSVVIVIVIIRLIEGRSIFFPMKGTPPVLADSLVHEDIFFKTSDGTRLHGWFIPASVPASGSSVFLFLHGNAGNIGHRWDKINILHGFGTPVFIFDYRGYGRSEGTPSEAGIYKDADAAYEYLTGQGFAPSKIIVYGESIGGAFAIDLGARKPVQAIIVEDTFTSIPAMVKRSMPFIPAFALATRLDSLSKIAKVRASKLFFHSVDDEIVPFAMGQALFEAADEPKRFVRLRGGHNTAFFDDLKTYQTALKDFLAGL